MAASSRASVVAFFDSFVTRAEDLLVDASLPPLASEPPEPPELLPRRITTSSPQLSSPPPPPPPRPTASNLPVGLGTSNLVDVPAMAMAAWMAASIRTAVLSFKEFEDSPAPLLYTGTMASDIGSCFHTRNDTRNGWGGQKRNEVGKREYEKAHVEKTYKPSKDNKRVKLRVPCQTTIPDLAAAVSRITCAATLAALLPTSLAPHRPQTSEFTSGVRASYLDAVPHRAYPATYRGH